MRQIRRVIGNRIDIEEDRAGICPSRYSAFASRCSVGRQKGAVDDREIGRRQIVGKPCGRDKGGVLGNCCHALALTSRAGAVAGSALHKIPTESCQSLARNLFKVHSGGRSHEVWLDRWLPFHPAWNRQIFAAQKFRVEELRLIARARIGEDGHDHMTWPEILGEADRARDINS